MSTLAVFLVIAGGSAIAAKVSVDSADVKNESLLSKDLKNDKAVASSDVIDDSLTGDDVDESSLGTVPSAQSASTAASVAANSVGAGSVIDQSLGAGDIASNALTTLEIQNGTLRTDDIGDGQVTLSKLSAGARDSCPAPATARYGRICAGSPDSPRSHLNAAEFCANLGLRLPSYSEAVTLARNYDVPGVESPPGSPSSYYFWTDSLFREGAAIYTTIVGESGGLAIADREESYEVVCVATPGNF